MSRRNLTAIESKDFKLCIRRNCWECNDTWNTIIPPATKLLTRVDQITRTACMQSNFIIVKITEEWLRKIRRRVKGGSRSVHKTRQKVQKRTVNPIRLTSTALHLLISVDSSIESASHNTSDYITITSRFDNRRNRKRHNRFAFIFHFWLYCWTSRIFKFNYIILKFRF